MPITSQNPVTVDYPEIPFDRLLVSIAVSPLIVAGGTAVEGAASLRCVPYRVRPDGQIETRDDRGWSYSTSQMFADSANDPALAAAVSVMFSSIQQFLSAKGV